MKVSKDSAHYNPWISALQGRWILSDKFGDLQTGVSKSQIKASTTFVKVSKDSVPCNPSIFPLMGKWLLEYKFDDLLTAAPKPQSKVWNTSLKVSTHSVPCNPFILTFYGKWLFPDEFVTCWQLPHHHRPKSQKSQWKSQNIQLLTIHSSELFVSYFCQIGLLTHSFTDAPKSQIKASKTSMKVSKDSVPCNLLIFPLKGKWLLDLILTTCQQGQGTHKSRSEHPQWKSQKIQLLTVPEPQLCRVGELWKISLVTC